MLLDWRAYYSRKQTRIRYFNQETYSRPTVHSHIASFLARDNIYAIARYMLSHVRLSVRPSVTRVDQSKTVEDRIMQLSPQSSPMTLVSSWLTPLVISIFV